MHTSQNITFLIILSVCGYKTKELFCIALCCTIVFIHNGICVLYTEESRIWALVLLFQKHICHWKGSEDKKNLYNLMFQIQHHVNSFVFRNLPSLTPANSCVLLQYLSLICTQKRKKFSKVVKEKCVVSKKKLNL